MLLGQDLRRRHHASLEAVVDGHEHTHQPHDGFATADISLKQAVHLNARAQVAADLPDHPFLCAGQLERQLLLVESVEVMPNRFKNEAFDGVFPAPADLQQAELQKEELLELQPVAGTLELLLITGKMNAAQGFIAGREAEFFDEVIRQVFRRICRTYLFEQGFGDPPAGAGVDPFGIEFIGAGIDRGEGGGFLNVLLAGQFHFRVRYAQLSPEAVDPAVDDVLFTYFQLLFQPMYS